MLYYFVMLNSQLSVLSWKYLCNLLYSLSRRVIRYQLVESYQLLLHNIVKITSWINASNNNNIIFVIDTLHRNITIKSKMYLFELPTHSCIVIS